MNVTERLRELLDDLGVEWEDMSVRTPAYLLRCTSWHDPDGEPCTSIEGADDIPDGKLSVQANLTPEQAIAATLGESAPGLPHFWTHDGTLHVELPKLPESIAVTLPDERDREVYSARAWRYVREDESDNARLRDQLDTAKHNAKRNLREYKRVCDENSKLREENANLESVLHEVEEDAVFAYRCLQSDVEHVMKSETEFFEKWWHAECRNDNKTERIEVLETENAKLRVLVANMLVWHYEDYHIDSESLELGIEVN